MKNINMNVNLNRASSVPAVSRTQYEEDRPRQQQAQQKHRGRDDRGRDLLTRQSTDSYASEGTLSAADSRYGVAEEDGEDDGRFADGAFDSTELLERTVGLLSAHKTAIAEMVEVMKDEMELVQEMENVDDRNSELYIDKLERILDVKSEAIYLLRNELNSFQQYREFL